MPAVDDMIDLFRVIPGKPVRLKDFDPSWNGDHRIPKKQRKDFAAQVLAEGVESLAVAQELLYAADSWSVLIIFQALDAAGKDGTIKHVMSGVNPQGVQVTSFKHPSAEELDHTFMWRCSKALPERGRIGIFNRSYYEEVLIVKVHPELVAAQNIPDAEVSDKFWTHRYEDINSFEEHLSRNGTLILKFFLHISKEEQRQRLLARINEPRKHWKFAASDLAERAFWKDYQAAYGEMLEATTTKHAPWYVIPADHKWVSRAMVSAIIAREIKMLDVKFPEVSDEKRRQIATAKAQLESE
ncbi:MAG: polyphosphate kinase 2 family protein [Planctomycetia bacterium]|nr:polyphosphate kinase 2 family protein [Planctomycetia bacterium]